MISSTSSSASAAARLAAAALAIALGACHRGDVRRAAGTAPRLAVFPVQNFTGGPAPVRALTASLDGALSQRGLSVVPRAALDAALAERRIRNTDGVDGEIADALRALGADAVLVPVLEAYRADPPPRMALRVRIVSTASRPVVLWATDFARAGDESPGVLGLRTISRVADLERLALATISDSVRGFVERGDAGPGCTADPRFRPRRPFRSPLLDDVGRHSVAVLPFVNESSARDAGESLMVQLVGQLARSRRFEVLDPTFVRHELLTTRMMIREGVTLDDARIVLQSVGADLILSGTVHVDEQPATSAPPRVELTVYALDRATGQLVWSSTSHGKGDDGVVLFDHGRVATSGELSCRIIRGVVDAIAGSRPPAPPRDAQPPATLAPAVAPSAPSASSSP